MAQYITLEEAAVRLGIPVADLKRRLKTEWTHVVPMRDGPTLRFRENQIEELARQLGAASDPSLPLAAIDDDDALAPGSDDFKVPSAGKTGRLPKTGKGAKPADDPLLFDDSVSDDIFSLTDNEQAALKNKGFPPPGTDSDVRLEGVKPARAGDENIVPTEEISLDMSGPGSAVIKGGSSAKLSAPKSSSRLTPDSGKKLGSDSAKNLAGSPLGDSSEFELSLDADSDDFELQLNTDSSDEVDLGSSPVDEGGPRAGKSGVNLRNPGDSGVSLEKGQPSGRNLGGKNAGASSRNLSGKKPDSARNLGGKKPDSGKKLPPPADDGDSDVDFELSLEEEPGASKPRLGAPRSSTKLPITSDSDSEFELTLDDSSDAGSLEVAALRGDDGSESKGDIFETDFEIPPMSDESGSEAVAIDSDTDLEDRSGVEQALDESDAALDEESGSQVVVLEDEDDVAPVPRSKRRKGPASGVGLVDDDDEGIGSALTGVKGRRHDEDDEDDEDAVAVRGGVAPPAPWGPLPALILAPAFALVILGGLMGYELLHTMMGYQQPRKPSAPLVRGVAKALDLELRDQ